MTQLLTGHENFAKYLFHIQKPTTDQCVQDNCEQGIDTPEHTIVECPVWGAERAELSAVIGDDLSLPNIVSKMMQSKAAWQAFSTYSERVL